MGPRPLGAELQSAEIRMRGEQNQITRPYRPRIPSRFNYSSTPLPPLSTGDTFQDPEGCLDPWAAQTGQVLGLFLYVPVYEDVWLTDPAQREMNKNNDNSVHW